MKSAINKLNKIYDNVTGLVYGSVHNTLWQIMVNDCLGGKEAAFDTLPSDYEIIIIALSDGGYIPANISVSEEKRDKVLEILNREVFGLTPDEAAAIMTKSFRD